MHSVNAQMQLHNHTSNINTYTMWLINAHKNNHTSVPDLRLDRVPINLDGAGGKLDPNRRLAVRVEFVASEAGQQVCLAHTRVSNQHDYYEILCVLEIWINRLKKVLLNK